MVSISVSGLFGCVGEFNVVCEMFSVYVERMEMFFIVNNIVMIIGEGSVVINFVVVNRKCVIFLIEVGLEVYIIFSNLLVFIKLKDVLFINIVEVLEKYYNLKFLEIV